MRKGLMSNTIQRKSGHICHFSLITQLAQPAFLLATFWNLPSSAARGKILHCASNDLRLIKHDVT